MKKYVVELTGDERASLTRLVSVGKGAARRLTRARTLLLADAGSDGLGWTDQRITEALGVSKRTVENLRRRCVEEGVESALERKPQQRPSRMRIFDGEKEARLVALCCSKPPQGVACWTMQLLADKAVELEIVESVSDETVRRTLKKRSETVATPDVVYCTGAEC